MTKIEEQMKYMPFLKEIVKRDIKQRYRSVSGVLAAMLSPLIPVLVMLLLFSAQYKRSVDNFPLYILCGQVIFSFMNGCPRRSMDAVTGNAVYIRSIYTPKYIFVLSRVTAGFVGLLLSLVPLAAVMLVTHARFSIYLLMLPTVFALMFIFTLGLSLIVAAYGTLFRDFQHLYGVFSTLWMLASAVFYPKTVVPVSFRFILDLNPAIHFIEITRAVCYQGTMPTEKSLIIATCYSVLMLLMGISVFKGNENKFFRHV